MSTLSTVLFPIFVVITVAFFTPFTLGIAWLLWKAYVQAIAPSRFTNRPTTHRQQVARRNAVRGMLASTYASQREAQTAAISRLSMPAIRKSSPLTCKQAVRTPSKSDRAKYAQHLGEARQEYLKTQTS